MVDIARPDLPVARRRRRLLMGGAAVVELTARRAWRRLGERDSAAS